MTSIANVAQLVTETQISLADALGISSYDLDPVLYPPDTVGCSGWFTLTVRVGTPPAAQLTTVMWDGTGWYRRGPTDPAGVWHSTGLPPDTEPADAGVWFSRWLAGLRKRMKS